MTYSIHIFVTILALSILRYADTLVLMPKIEYGIIQTKTTEKHKPHKDPRF